MRLQIFFEGNGLFVITDGVTEWIMSPNKVRHPKYISCKDTVCFFGDDGLLDLYSFKEQRLKHRINIGPSIRYDGKPDSSPSDKLLVNSTQSQIIVVQRNASIRTRIVTVIDPLNGSVIARHENLPNGWHYPIYQQHDDQLVFPVKTTFEGDKPTRKTIPEGGEIKSGLMWVDPLEGLQKLSVLPSDIDTGYFHSPSPTGQYWLKPDPTVLPIKDVKKRKFLGIKTQTKRYYGLSVQLWEAEPLRFIRSITVAWFDETQMPDGGNVDWQRERKGLMPIKGRYYDLLSATLETANLNPLKVLKTENLGLQVKAMFAGEEYGEFLQYGVDYTEFFGRASVINNWIAGWSDDETFTNSDGSIRININGEVTKGEATKKSINNADIEKENRKKRAIAFMKKRMAYTIPLASMGQEDCIEAILALTDRFDEELPHRAYERKIKLVFRCDGKSINEVTFFKHVLRNCPKSVAALRALLIKHHSCTGPWDFIYSKPSDGEEFLGTAAYALGILDGNSMDVLRLFAERIDSSHQYSFCQRTLPAIIKQHGLTKGVLELVIWVMLFKSGNSVEPNVVWREYGVRKALETQYSMPQAINMFKSVLKSETNKNIKDIQAGDFFGPILNVLEDPNDKWQQQFFAELS